MQTTGVVSMKMKIRFSSEEEATLTKLVLDVDTELQPLKIERSTSVDDRMLFMYVVCWSYSLLFHSYQSSHVFVVYPLS